LGQVGAIMRTAVFVFAALAAFAFVSPAWAVVVDTDTKVTNTGSEVPSATVTITQKDASGKVTDKDEVKVTERRKTARTSVRVDTRKTSTVEITVKLDGREEKKIVSREEFLGGTIDLGHGLTLQNTPRTAERPPSRGRPSGPQPSAVPRPMPTVADFWIERGFFVAGFVVFNSADLGITEKLADTGETTFRSNEHGSATGGGISVLLTPGFMAGGIPLVPFFSASFLNQKVAHVFGPGRSIGENIKVVLEGGVQFPIWLLRPYLPANLELYGIAGVVLVDKEFQIFGSNDEQWLWGGKLGVGILYRPPELRGVGVFVQYQHIWVERGDVRMPPSSPAFNYSFGNEMDIVTAGLLVNFGGKGPTYSGAGPTWASDIRLKHDIELVARLDNGLGLYRYRYLWSDTEYVGVMAQEVAEVVPDAVVRGSDGYLRVDYGRLGLKLMTWEEWVVSDGERFRRVHLTDEVIE
jgi:hypothetical protein